MQERPTRGRAGIRRLFAVLAVLHALAATRIAEAAVPKTTVRHVRPAGTLDHEMPRDHHDHEDHPSERGGSYEIAIQVERADLHYCTEHPHPWKPTAEVLRQLKDEAVDVFRTMYEDEPDEVGVHVTFLAEERDAVPVRED